ncbi:hypothetical protein BG005_011013 [Podila minutissima]|nr:hypothetical protein BG005_011013 [Podila minutissima]
MSLQVNFTTHGRELKAAYDAILRPTDAKSGDNWAMFGYDKGSNDLKVLGQGAGGLEELEDEFVDGKIQYAFARIIDPNSQLNKFILIGWCGDGVPESKKGLFSSHLADVSQFLKGYHLQINARSESDVTPAYIMKRVNEGSGSKYSIHKETYEQERIRPLQSAYKKTEIPDIAALQRNPTKPESAPKYNVGSKPVLSTPPAKPAEPSWKSSSSSSAPSPPTSSSSSAASKIQSWNKIGQGSSYISSTSSSFNKVAPPPSLANYGITTSSVSTPNDPSMNKAQQIRLEREAREKEERERIAKEIRDREARERKIDDQSGAQKQAEERRLQEQREREQEQQRSQDRAREERAAREREERERSEAEDAARSAREAAKAREDAQARDRAAQAEDQQRQKEQEQRQREREEREESDRIAKQKKDEEARRKKQQEEEEEERRQQAEEERRQQEAADEQRRFEEEEHERRLQQEVDAAATKTLELGADALIASSAHPEVASGSVSAVVLYSYEKAEENEMSLFEGEIITNVTELDVGWWSGESEDGTRSGLFPANYVEIIEHAHQEPAAAAPVYHEEEHHVQETHPAASNHVDEVLSSKPTAVALYDYNAGEPNEISFSEGDIIVEIDFVTEDWWSGHSQDGTRSGLFPSNYVELHQ